MLITKNQFRDSLSCIKAHLNEAEEFSNDMEKYFDGWPMIKFGNKLTMTYLSLLSQLVGDEADSNGETILEWWLFEDVKKVITVDQKVFNVEEIDDLYNYFYFMESYNAKKEVQ